jgi:DNA (cytosine-5)-methyltransferase 1
MARRVVDLYCGSGGVTAGLKAAGWQVIAACDNDPIASSTYRSNHPEVRLIEKDIRDDCTITEIVAAAGGLQVDLLVVCAPCQPFSSQNRKRGNDPREELIVRSLAVIPGLRPGLIFFENVPGLATASYLPILEELRSCIAEFGYSITTPLLRDAACYGVPQRRRRCVMLAARNEMALKTFRAAKIEQAKRTVHQAISDLSTLEPGDAHPTDSLHRARRHSSLAIERLRHVSADGGSRKSLPAHLELRCHRGSDAFPDVYGRMKWDAVAPTLTTGCTDVTKGRFAHPDQHRAISLREAARLQTFADDYKFQGNVAQVARQIGNAVPPAMITAFAAAFEAALADVSA